MNKVDILARWGLSSNPFEVRPLQPNERDMSLFVARDQQINRVLNTLQDMNQDVCRRICVICQVGTGKSSFLNRIEYELKKGSGPDCLCIRIEGGGYSTLEFLVILMEKICVSLLSFGKINGKEKKIVLETREKLAYTVEYLSSKSATVAGTISAIVAQIKGTVTEKEQKKYHPKAYNENDARDDFEVLSKITTNHLDGILICIDEADRLMATDLLVGGRNIFFTGGCSFILVGKQTLKAEIDRKGSPLREIFEDFIELPGLTYPEYADELTKMVTKRIESARSEKELQESPFTEQALTEIFRASEGILRNVIRYCYQTLEFAIERQSIVDAEVVKIVLRRNGESLERELTVRGRELAQIIYKMGGQVYPSDPKLQELYGRSSAGLRSKLKELEINGIVRGSIDKGGKLRYSLTSEINAFYLAKKQPSGIVEDMIQANIGITDKMLDRSNIDSKIIMFLAKNGSASANELFEQVFSEVSPKTLSYHLTKLIDSGIVTSSFVSNFREDGGQFLNMRYSLTGELGATVKILLEKLEYKK